MKPDEKKPVVDTSGSALSGAGSKEWMKKLEAATGKPVELGGTPHISGAGGSANVEQRTVQFRCAETGKAFFVLFARYSPSHSFQLVSVSKASEAATVVGRHATSRTGYDRRKLFDASDFDWTGWFCPHCGFKETFCQCGKCGEYICGKRIRRLQDGTETFACHDGCGETGKITGSIESYNASQGHGSTPNQAVLKRPSSPTGALPSAKDHYLPPGSPRHA